ncbi:MAG: response regulator [Butyrivibrio sp.]|nr:response regulator [Acetatifactor muris]MCM1559689.1 response regulator [Butyrivibrio sp.]
MKTFEELNQLFGKSEQAFLVTGLPLSEDAVLVYGNAAAAALTEINMKEISGHRFRDLGEQWKEKRHMYSSAFDSDMCLIMIVDMTDVELKAEENYRQYCRNMENALEHANDANQAKTKFLSEMSHDIRTPMNAIVGMTDIALKYIEDTKRVEDCLKKIKVASGHLMGLINEVLDMSRIESGKVTLMLDDFQLMDLIHSIVIVIKPQAEKKQIRFRLEIGEILYENLQGDAMRIQQIYINLLSNAVKYTEDGGEVCMRISQEQGENGMIRLLAEVEDNGIGMTPEFVKHIFDPFERERNTTLSKIEGTGLGMSITKKLVEMMQGHITVESRKGEGSRFKVCLQLELSDKGTAFEKNALAGRRVLVLQGAAEKLERLPEMLRRFGMEADVASCGMEAVDLMNDADIGGLDYFAMLTADKLADMEISLFLPEICARKGKHFPILLLSENDWSEEEYLLGQAGVTSFLPLPLSESRLAEALYAYTEECANRQAQAQQESRKNYGNSRILLVEDNELNMEIAVEILSSTGAQIDTAYNGQEAVQAFSQKPEFYYSLILMDIQMPVMDGLEAARRIRALERADASEVAIVSMTANAFAEDRQRSVEAGMNGHITKPIDVEQLLECLSRWCGR